jgi:hypothetical protein
MIGLEIASGATSRRQWRNRAAGAEQSKLLPRTGRLGFQRRNLSLVVAPDCPCRTDQIG